MVSQLLSSELLLFSSTLIHILRMMQINFQSSLLSITDFQCAGFDHKVQEECAYQHEIVFPRMGMFTRYDAYGKMIADVNQVLFFNKFQPYQITHPQPGGDRTAIFSITENVLQAMCDDEQPFNINAAFLESAHKLAFYALLQRITSGGDPLEIEEHAILLLGSVIQTNETRIQFSQEMVDAVRMMLAQRFADSLKLEEIASAVHASPYWLCRLFKKYTGFSIHQYLQRIRLNLALEFLMECPRLSLAEVAMETGFYSHSHFTTAFSQEFKLSPSVFRKMGKILEA